MLFLITAPKQALNMLNKIQNQYNKQIWNSSSVNEHSPHKLTYLNVNDWFPVGRKFGTD